MTKQLDELAFQFFKLFAQYESALKENGFFKADNSGNVIVDWDRFANHIVGKNFKSELGPSDFAAEYILDNPPMRQIVVDEKVVWAAVPAIDKSVQILFGHICRVRNNLFHGAKFNGSWFDPDRSKLLLKNSLLILSKFKEKLNV